MATNGRHYDLYIYFSLTLFLIQPEINLLQWCLQNTPYYSYSKVYAKYFG